MAKQFEENRGYLVGGNLLNRYEQAADSVLGVKPNQPGDSPDTRPWLVGVCNGTETRMTAGTTVGRKALITTPDSVSATASDPKDWFCYPINYEIELYSASAHADSFLILVDDLQPGEIGKAAGQGEVKIKINILDASHKYAKFKSTQPAAGDYPAQLESAASGPFRIVSQPDGLGELWCTASFPVQPKNIHADDAENVFTIDRTNEGDDSKTWNPGNNEPEDWRDYDCVMLTVGYLRYDATAGTLKHVTQEYHWAAGNAPIIPVASVADADTGSC